MRAPHIISLLLASAALLACAAEAPPPPQAPSPPPIVIPPPRSYATVTIEGVPHVRQKPDFCGEACVSMALAKLGRPLDQDVVFDLSLVDPALGRGVVTHELDRTLRRIGFDPGAVWYPVNPARAGAELDGLFASLHADLLANVPSIVCMHYDEAPNTTEHFRLVTGYDAATDEVLYHEPARDNGAYQRMSRARFLTLWPLKPSASSWAAIRLRLAPGPSLVQGPLPKAGLSNADYAQHVLAVKRKLGPRARDFTFVIEPPFVVIGDEGQAAVKSHAARTVRWAKDQLKRLYFKKDPAKILDVWLFRDKESYERNVMALYNERPSTHFGYYSSQNNALVMNISTGTGTLVHELVHPYIEANFPGCPAWLNEGLGSLYEQSGEERGHIWGYTNWRLPHLQKAIRQKKLPSFERLARADDETFYDRDPGTNYGQARYLLYYLQDKGLLVKLFQEYAARRADDPSGYEALKRVLGEEDMAAFQRRWEAYVLDLVFPRALEVR